MLRCRVTIAGKQCLNFAETIDGVCLHSCRFSEDVTAYSTVPRDPITYEHKGADMSVLLYKVAESPRTSPDVPYYKGRGGLEARDVVESFQLGYHVGTAVVYCLRAGKKPGNTFVADIEKAFNHLRFALEDMKRDV